MTLKQERTLLIVVGCTSTESNEKSQYCEKVFCHEAKGQMSYQGCKGRRTGWGKVKYLI